MQATFTGPGGSDPLAYLVRVQAAAKPTVGDLLYAGQSQRTRIRVRTAAGIDVNGSPFAPYSPKYKARKAKALGHADTVDLFGFDRGVHMLNAILVKCEGRESAGYAGSATADPQPARSFVMGIYDEELAQRARVHNQGSQIRTHLGFGSTAIGGQHPLFTSRGKGAKQKFKAAYFNMPKREFFGASADDILAMEQGIGARQLARLESLPK